MRTLYYFWIFFFFNSLACCSENTERTSGVSRWRQRGCQPIKKGKVQCLSHFESLDRKGTEWKGAPLEEQTDAAACWEGGQPFSHLPFFPALIWCTALSISQAENKILIKKNFCPQVVAVLIPLGSEKRYSFIFLIFMCQLKLLPIQRKWNFHFCVPLWSSSYFQPLKKPKDVWNTWQNTWLIHPYN